MEIIGSEFIVYHAVFATSLTTFIQSINKVRALLASPRKRG